MAAGGRVLPLCVDTEICVASRVTPFMTYCLNVTRRGCTRKCAHILTTAVINMGKHEVQIGAIMLSLDPCFPSQPPADSMGVNTKRNWSDLSEPFRPNQ